MTNQQYAVVDMGKKVLIVDDEYSVRLAFRTVLEKLGYEVNEASFAEEAINKAKEKSYDLIYMDLVIPRELNGVETFKRIREFDKKVPVCMITAYFDKMAEVEKEAVLAGMEYQVLYKPIWKEEIIKATKNLIGEP